MRPCAFALSFVVIGCAQKPLESAVTVSPEATRFFEDYVRSDASSQDTLPIFLEACGGDFRALRMVFTDYERFGSGDNEAWGDVPDVILREAGDHLYAEFLTTVDTDTRWSSLRWLGPPGSTLFDEADLRHSFPLTSRIQQIEFAKFASDNPQLKKPGKARTATPRKPSD